MARTGRPPVPAEVKRRRGTARPDRMPDIATVTPLPMADGVPDAPDDLLLDGRRMWVRAWSSAITWLSPESDMESIEQACRLADDVSQARRRYRATSDPSDARAVVALSKEFSDALSRLGFDPTARSKLGVAEVKRASALDDLLARRNATD